jgi:peroxiredoxin
MKLISNDRWILLFKMFIFGVSVFLIHCTQQANILIHQRYQETQQRQQENFKKPLRVFKFNDVNGQSYLLNDWHHKAILLHIFTTWCDSCFHEVKRLNHLYQDGILQGYKVFAICAEGRNCPNINVFKKMSHVRYPIYISDLLLLNGQGLMNEQISLPTTYILDTNGSIIQVFKGQIPMQYAKRLLRDLSNSSSQSHLSL